MGCNIKFSVLCSLYYKEKSDYLDACLTSIQVQSYRPDEIVIVHDGPLTDELYVTLSKWDDILPIQHVYLNDNVGLGNALNAGLKACKNDIVARIDADDICHPERFKKQCSHLIDNQDLGLLSSDVLEFQNVPHDIRSIRKVPQNHSEIIKYSKKRNPFNHMAVMFRKSSVIKSGGYMDFKYMEDYYLWLRMLNDGVITENIGETLVYARVGNGMVARRRGLDYIISELKLAAVKYKMGVCNKSETLMYLTVRATSRVFPVTLLEFVYNKFSRVNR